MKQILAILILAMTIACGTDNGSQTELQTIIKEKDSLQSVYKSLGERIAELDQQIQALDTTKNLTQVSTLKLESGDFAHFINVYGNVEASKSISMFPEMPGKVVAILVEEGQEVSRGQLLVQLESDMLRNQLKEVETNLELANTIYEKQDRLWKKNIGSEVEYLQAKSTKESLEARKKAILAQIEMSEIRAPFNGVIDNIMPKVGEVASGQSPILRLINIDDVYIEADVSEVHLTTIKKGAYAEVEFPALKKTIETAVSHTGKFINPNNRTFNVKIDLSGKEEIDVNPNLLAKVKIKDFEIKDSALHIPSRMIQQTPRGEDFVMVLSAKDGKNMVKKQMIKTGISYEGETLITEGLNEGAVLIDKGARSVKDGQEVDVN